jgi:regulator of PEP synthase PpsR (kinase-PPPase family)
VSRKIFLQWIHESDLLNTKWPITCHLVTPSPYQLPGANIMDESRITELTKGPPLYVVSGGTGASGELLVRTVLAQFHHVSVPLIIKPHILSTEQVEDVVDEISDAEGTIVHSMVNQECRRHLVDLAARKGIYSVDLVAPLLDHLEAELRQEPQGKPGLYRQLHSAYFDRVAAIEFAVAHDDGKRVEDLSNAEIVLVGVSRAGKTPISMYLSILGWKVANVPFVFGLPLPDELAEIAPGRLVALMIEPTQLLAHRRWRQKRTGIPEGNYAAREPLVEELRAANHYFHREGIPVVNTTEKPIETSADEVIALVTGRSYAEPEIG